MYYLERFIEAQKDTYPTALQEIKNGQKESHWMWFIFPQLKGLGLSYYANYYGIENFEEAKAYLEHEVLKSRLLEISYALIQHDKNIKDILGEIDTLKLQSSMTLFHEVDENIFIFQEVLDKFYHGKKDEKTLQLLKKDKF